MSDTPGDRARGAFGLPGPARPESLAKRIKRGVPVTAVQVEEEIFRLSALMEDTTDEFAGRARTAGEAEVNHKGRWASEYLTAEGTEASRKAAADVKVHDLYMRRKIAEAQKESTKELLLTLRAELDALRSISANIRAQS